jgi:hypothetical protein
MVLRLRRETSLLSLRGRERWKETSEVGGEAIVIEDGSQNSWLFSPASTILENLRTTGTGVEKRARCSGGIMA